MFGFDYCRNIFKDANHRFNKNTFRRTNLPHLIASTHLRESQVKGGGHSTNQGFSSTTGVQIAMYRFSEVMYHPDNNTADIGMGLIWDEVYQGMLASVLLE